MTAGYISPEYFTRTLHLLCVVESACSAKPRDAGAGHALVPWLRARPCALASVIIAQSQSVETHNWSTCHLTRLTHGTMLFGDAM